MTEEDKIVVLIRANEMLKAQIVTLEEEKNQQLRELSNLRGIVKLAIRALEQV